MFAAWKDRRGTFGRYDRYGMSWLSGFIGVVVAIPLIFVGFSQAHASAQNVQSKAATHWHAVTADVTSRGPYQGDSASMAYRLAEISYPDWNNHTQTGEYMVNWGTHVHDHLPILVGDAGGVYFPADLNNFYYHVRSPLSPSIGSAEWWTFIRWFAVYVIAVWALAFAAYFLIITIRTQVQESRRQAAAT